MEILTVLRPSPPVPTMSTILSTSEKSTGVAKERMASAAAASSAAVMPLTRRPKAKAEIRTSLARPAMISFIAHAVWDSLSSSRRPRRSSRPGQVK